jgi:hypothetical protein
MPGEGDFGWLMGGARDFEGLKSERGKKETEDPWREQTDASNSASMRSRLENPTPLSGGRERGQHLLDPTYMTQVLGWLGQLACKRLWILRPNDPALGNG